MELKEQTNSTDMALVSKDPAGGKRRCGWGENEHPPEIYSK